MAGEVGPTVHVAADLRFEIDGATATVSGAGSDITVQCSDPARLLASISGAQLPVGVSRVDGPRALGRAADALGSAGLQLTVSGPDGAVLTLGRDARSSVVRVVTGSARVQPGAWVATRPLLRAALVARLARLRRRPTGS
jgi:hypothetical protein